MSDFSDVILLIGAMLIFSMLSLTTARSYQMDNSRIYNADAEYRAITTGQSIIDELKWKTIEDEFKPNNNKYYFKNFPKTTEVTYGQNNQYRSLFTINGSSTVISDFRNIRKYRINISVKSDEITDGNAVNLEFIKSFHY